eukprot:Skav220804  [mRNA]  locus=scaffold150:419661:421577:- [translate_table: standard]
MISSLAALFRISLGLPHLAGHIVASAQLVAETLTVAVDHQAAHATQGLSGQKLDLGLRIIVGWTWTHSKSMLRAPMASPILMPSPVVWSPLVVGRWRRSGRYLASRESSVKSAPKPPVARITGPSSVKSLPFFS